MHYAAAKSPLDTFTRLLEVILPSTENAELADIARSLFKADNQGLTALHYAAQNGQWDNFNILLERILSNYDLFGGDIVEQLFAADNQGLTALHYAAFSSPNTLETLLNFISQNIDNNNPKLAKIAASLLNYDAQGKTALHYQPNEQSEEILNKLLNFISRNINNNQKLGKTLQSIFKDDLEHSKGLMKKLIWHSAIKGQVEYLEELLKFNDTVLDDIKYDINAPEDDKAKYSITKSMCLLSSNALEDDLPTCIKILQVLINHGGDLIKYFKPNSGINDIPDSYKSELLSLQKIYQTKSDPKLAKLDMEIKKCSTHSNPSEHTKEKDSISLNENEIEAFKKLLDKLKNSNTSEEETKLLEKLMQADVNDSNKQSHGNNMEEDIITQPDELSISSFNIKLSGKQYYHEDMVG